MIRKFVFENLHGKINAEASVHPDINIVTGINGSGKTTVLKSLWYLASANIERLFQETVFDRAFIETDAFWLDIRVGKSDGKRKVVEFETSFEGLSSFHLSWDKVLTEPERIRLLNQLCMASSNQTLFFPTFRRIEGGFSLASPRSRRPDSQQETIFIGSQLHLDNALRHLSDRLSSPRHTFICSLSTDDVANLLTAKYAAVSEQTNRMLTQVAERIVNVSRSSSGVGSNITPAAFQDVVNLAKEVEQEKSVLLKPFSVLSDLVKQIFAYNGIRVNRAVSLGDSESAIQSEHLSAGEKQMLSFLVYNAFFSNANIFIDEPELSLHVDWQRRLFSLLMDQGTSNQFFVATHSPFIYHKFQDKELLLGDSRGD